MKYLATLLIFTLAFSCKNTATVVSEKPNAVKAKILADKFILVDGHVDLPHRLKVKNFRLEKEFTDIPVESGEGDFDFVRAKKGGLNAPIMSIYIPSSKSPVEGKALADTLIKMIELIAIEKSDYFQLAKSPQDVIKAVNAGKIALPMGMENGSPITSVEDVAYYKEKGISYVTLTHGQDNDISDSSYDTTHTWNGLSPFGKEVVKAMNKSGIMVDVSHISDDAFYDVMKITKVPVIASHSSVRHFTPNWERNMSDDLILALKENGGVIMVNFGSTFLDSDVSKYKADLLESLRKELQEKGLEGAALREAIRKAVSSDLKAYSDVHRVADHIDHIVKLIGMDYIGIGSDYDGVGDSLPTGLKDVADYPNLIEELLNRGYADSDIEKIWSGNVFRVWNEVLKYAKDNS